MGLQTRKLLSNDDDDDLKDFCKHYCELYSYGSCSSDCRSKCKNSCLSSFPVSIPPPDFPPHKSAHKLSIWLTCTITILSFTFFLILCYAVYLRFYPRRRRRRSDPPPAETHQEFLDEEHGPVLDHPIWYIRTVGLPPSVIAAIGVCRYKPGEGLIDGTECSVCLSEFEEDETLRLLPKCSHAFHLPCIDTWLRSHTNCPMCRAPIVVETAAAPPEDSAAANPEETHIGNLRSSGESERWEESDVTENEEAELGFPERVDNSEEGSGIGDFQPMRRSVSLDSLSVLQLKLDFQTESGREINPEKVRENQSVASCLNNTGSSSSEKSHSQQRGRSSMKRSVSCSGKFLLRTSTQRSNTINYS